MMFAKEAGGVTAGALKSGCGPLSRLFRGIGLVVGMSALLTGFTGCGSSHSSTTTTRAASTLKAPVCSHPICHLGVIPSGPYKVTNLLTGTTVDVPGAGWQVEEDSTGELKLTPPGNREAHIFFWLDPAAVSRYDTPVPGVGKSPEALLAFLRANRDLIVSPPQRRTIAGGVVARSVDIDVKRDGFKADPSCPGACLDYLVLHYPGGKGYPGGKFFYGTGSGEPVRLYLAKIKAKGKQRVLAVSVDAPDPKTFRSLTATATGMLNTLQLPVS